MAIVSNVPRTIPGGQSIVFAGFSSGVNCINLPFANPTTICFPFGDQQQHFAFRFGSMAWNSVPCSFKVYVLSAPVSVHKANVELMTGFQQSWIASALSVERRNSRTFCMFCNCAIIVSNWKGLSRKLLLTGVRKDATEYNWMWGVPLSFTATARMELSQLVAMWVVGAGSGSFLVGIPCFPSLAVSRSFRQTTISSGFDDPTNTIPWQLALAMTLHLAPTSGLLASSINSDLLWSRNEIS